MHSIIERVQYNNINTLSYENDNTLLDIPYNDITIKNDIDYPNQNQLITSEINQLLHNKDQENEKRKNDPIYNVQYKFECVYLD